MSQVNKRAKPTWADEPNRIRGNKLQSSAWESAIAVFGFLAGIIGAFCNFIIKNKKGIMDVCHNVAAVSATLYASFNPSKGRPKINKRRPKTKK